MDLLNEPIPILNTYIDQTITIFLRDNIKIEGILKGFDEYNHFILENSEMKITIGKNEYLKNSDRILLNGNNIEVVRIIYISIYYAYYRFL